MAVLPRYIARRILGSIAAAAAIIFLVISFSDFVNLITRLRDDSPATFGDLAILSLQRSPAIMEVVFPFAVLFGSIAAFVSLSRRMELVVARASGVSVWQIVTPAVLAAAVLGALVTTVYNPVSVALQERAITYEAALFPGAESRASGRWLRQQSEDGQSVLRARGAIEHGEKLAGVTAFVFSPAGTFEERLDAASGELHDGYWELSKVRVSRHGAAPRLHETYRLATNLTREQVFETAVEPRNIPFWELGRVIEQWQNSGLKPERFQLHFQALLAKPAVFATMVLLAATVSLGFARLGGVSRAILGGVIAGFVLYVAGEMAGDLGASGFITPVVAAWAPSIVAMLLSVTVLLHQEDG